MGYTSHDFAVIVIWYNPSAEQVSNTEFLLTLLSPVLIIDNSEKCSNSAIKLSVGSYYWMGANHGIATALNYGCRLAEAKGSNFALILDQDSVLNPSMLQKHLASAKNIFDEQRVAVVATASQRQVDQPSPQIFEVKSAITSGSIIRLSAWHEIWGFNDALFIDQVDHDFCIRLRLRGFRVFVNSDIEMLHCVGDPIERYILGYRIKSTNHHWVRRYYQVRNSLYLRRWYPKESKSQVLYWRDLLEMIIGILVLEKDRRRKLYAMMIAILDFYHNRMGPWQGVQINAK